MSRVRNTDEFFLIIRPGSGEYKRISSFARYIFFPALPFGLSRSVSRWREFSAEMQYQQQRYKGKPTAAISKVPRVKDRRGGRQSSLDLERCSKIHWSDICLKRKPL